MLYNIKAIKKKKQKIQGYEDIFMLYYYVF